MNRDHADERAQVNATGSAFVLALSELRQLATKRARPEPVATGGGRSFRTEAREELADAMNYLAWGVQVGEIQHEQAHLARTHVALAWQALRSTT